MAKASRIAAKQADSMETLANVQNSLADRLARIEAALARLENAVVALAEKSDDPKKAK